ncbi:MAG TPA: AAA family ATPase [Pedobacter sp.]|nr:AAA family ATPase [Pedobacter sp.]
MELKFIWVKDYGPIQNQGFNFNNTSGDVFHYDGKRISISKSRPNVLDFGQNITGVTALAGQNGSGKSSLCQVVLLSTATYANGMFGYDMTFDGIVCYDNHVFYHEALQLENLTQLEQYGYRLRPYKESPLEKLEFEFKRHFVSGGFIYYTNLFDFRSVFEGVNLKNISSVNQLYEDTRFSVAHYQGDREFKQTRPPKDALTEANIYSLEEEHKQVKYYLENFDKIPFNGPKLVTLKSAYSYNNRWLRFSEGSDYNQTRFYDEIQGHLFDEIHQFYGVDYRDHELMLYMESVRCKELTEKLYRLNLIRAAAILYEKFFGSADISAFVYDNVLPTGLKELSGKIRELADLHLQLSAMARYKEGFSYKPYSMYSYYENRVEDWRFLLIDSMHIPNDENGRPLLSRLLKLEHEFMNTHPEGGVRRLSSCRFPSFFSSGEQGFLTLFSRLDEAIKLYSGEDQMKKNLAIFIDEGDAGFHPSWSKLFFKWILDFLNRRKEDLKYQLIFSTHSPYLLSDLTSEHVLLLQRGKSGFTEIVSSEAFETFGANIHDLLATSFFLNDGTIGEFAKIEINRVIDDLNLWRQLKQRTGTFNQFNISDQDKSRCLNIITSIGDYIVRGKLFEMYQEVFEDNQIAEAEINYLEERIKRLRKP